MDWLWRARDGAISVVFGVSGQTLNGNAAGEGGDPLVMAEALCRAALEVKGAALEPDGGVVAYGRVRGSDEFRRMRDELAPALAAADPGVLWNDDQRIAFWANCYNALTIQAAITAEVDASVRDVRGGLVGFFRRSAYTVGGLRFSLEDIEQGVLRANRGHPRIPGPHFSGGDARRGYCLAEPDPRLHFVLHCGAVSCPPVGVMRADSVGPQLDLASASFLNGAEGVRVDVEAGTVLLPRVMSWYGVDFGGKRGAQRFAARYVDDEAERALLESGRLKVRFREYDWRLG